MKRFLLFEGLKYYPSGGVFDFLKDFDTLKEAQSQPKEEIDWQNVLDTKTGKKYIWHSTTYNLVSMWEEIDY
jgi:hypothetical protein